MDGNRQIRPMATTEATYAARGDVMANHYVEWVQIYPLKRDERLKTICSCGERKVEWVINGRSSNLTRSGQTQWSCGDCLEEVLLSQKWSVRWGI